MRWLIASGLSRPISATTQTSSKKTQIRSKSITTGSRATRKTSRYTRTKRRGGTLHGHDATLSALERLLSSVSCICHTCRSSSYVSGRSFYCTSPRDSDVPPTPLPQYGRLGSRKAATASDYARGACMSGPMGPPSPPPHKPHKPFPVRHPHLCQRPRIHRLILPDDP